MNEFDRVVYVKFTRGLERDEWAFVRAWSTCGTYGPLIADGPVLAVPRKDAQALGKSIIEALNYCRYGISLDSWKGADKPLHEAFQKIGVKSLKKIEKKIHNIEVVIKKYNIDIFPMRSIKDGSFIIQDRVITLDRSNLTTQDLGEAVKKAFELCE